MDAETLRRRMLALGLTYYTLGTEAGVAHTTIWRWLRGTHPPSKVFAAHVDAVLCRLEQAQQDAQENAS